VKTAWDIGENTGVGIGFGRSGDGKDLVLQHKQDCTPFIKANKAAYNDVDGFSAHGQNFVKAFSLAPIAVMAFEKQYGLKINDPNDREQIITMLHRPEFAAWRTTPGNFMKRPERQHFAAGRRRQRSRIVKIGSLAKPAGATDIGTRGMFS